MPSDATSKAPSPGTPLPDTPSPLVPASISPIVDANYRLYASDLEGATRHVEVANVTFQGVEAMTPVLHFVGQTKRLVMSPEHVAQMVEISGTVLMDHWIGTQVLLQPQMHKHMSHIDIKPMTRRGRARPMPTYRSEDHRGWILAWSVIAVILCGSIIVAVLNYQTLIATLQQLLELWPLR